MSERCLLRGQRRCRHGNFPSETQWIGQLLDPFGVTALEQRPRGTDRRGAEHRDSRGRRDSPLESDPLSSKLGSSSRVQPLGCRLQSIAESGSPQSPGGSEEALSITESRPATEASGRGIRPKQSPSPLETTMRVLAPATPRVFSRHSVLIQFYMTSPPRGDDRPREHSILQAFSRWGSWFSLRKRAPPGNLFGMPVYPITYLMPRRCRACIRSSCCSRSFSTW